MSADLQLKAAVIATLAYTTQFEYPLSLAEITERLVRLNGTEGSVAAKNDHKKVREAVKALEQESVVRKWPYKLAPTPDTWYVLVGNETFFKLRLQREKLTARKQSEIALFLKTARHIPGLQAVAITGSVAMQNTQPDDDVDFMLVTTPHQLWLVRLLVTLIAWWHGKRRSWQGEEKNSWCFNLWLTEETLAVPVTKQSFYTAYEVRQVRFVWDKNRVQEKFYQDNKWAQKYVGEERWNRKTYVLDSKTGGREDSSVEKQHSVGRGRSHHSTALSVLFTFLNQLAFYVQYAYMKPHMTRETIDRQRAFFHPRPTGYLIHEKWIKTLEKVLKQPAAKPYYKWLKSLIVTIRQ